MRQLFKVVGLALCLSLAGSEMSTGQTDSSQTAEIRALEDILIEEISLSTAAIMLERCWSLYVVIGNWLKTQQSVRDETARVLEYYDKTADEMLRYWLGIAERTLNGNQEAHLELFKGKKDIIMKTYFERMNKATVLMGGALEDVVVQKDLQICKNYQSVLASAVEQSGIIKK